jgi:hypothetical protein
MNRPPVVGQTTCVNDRLVLETFPNVPISACGSTVQLPFIVRQIDWRTTSTLPGGDMVLGLSEEADTQDFANRSILRSSRTFASYVFARSDLMKSPLMPPRKKPS